MANTKNMTPEEARAEYQRRWETRRRNKMERQARSEKDIKRRKAEGPAKPLALPLFDDDLPACWFEAERSSATVH